MDNAVGRGLAPAASAECRVQSAECRVQNAELENVEQPLLMGEVAGAKRVTERDFEEIEVASKVESRRIYKRSRCSASPYGFDFGQALRSG